MKEELQNRVRELNSQFSGYAVYAEALQVPHVYAKIVNKAKCNVATNGLYGILGSTKRHIERTESVKIICLLDDAYTNGKLRKSEIEKYYAFLNSCIRSYKIGAGRRGAKISWDFWKDIRDTVKQISIRGTE